MLTMHSTTAIPVHPAAMQLNFAMSPTLTANQCSFASSDGQRYVTAGPSGELQPVILPTQALIPRSAVRYAVPLQPAAAAPGVSPMSMSPTTAMTAGSRTAFPCFPSTSAGHPQSAMTAVRPVFVPAVSATAAAAAGGSAGAVTSPMHGPAAQWHYPYTAGDAVTGQASAYGVQAPAFQGYARPTAFAGIHHGAPVYAACNPYINYAEAPGRMKRARDCTRPLRDWLMSHRHNPYPQKVDKCQLMFLSGLSINQVSMWFANARRRIKKVGMKAWSKGLCDDLPGTTAFDDDGDNEDAEVGSDEALPDSDCVVDGSASDKSDSFIACTPVNEQARPRYILTQPAHGQGHRELPGRSLSCSDADYSQHQLAIGTIKRHSLETTAIEFSPVATPQSSYGMADKWSSSSGYATCNDLPQNTNIGQQQQASEAEEAAPHRPSRPLITPVGMHIPSLMMSSLLPATTLAQPAPGMQWCLRQPAEMPAAVVACRSPWKQAAE